MSAAPAIDVDETLRGAVPANGSQIFEREKMNASSSVGALSELSKQFEGYFGTKARPSSRVLQELPLKTPKWEDMAAAALTRRITTRVSLERLPPRALPTFFPLQEWEGYVISVSNDHLLANLVDLTHGDNSAKQEVEIPLEELAEEDIPKLSPGRVFRWAIGYQRSPSGTKSRFSNIVFRELPQWTRKDIADAHAEAESLSTFLNGK